MPNTFLPLVEQLSIASKKKIPSKDRLAKAIAVAVANSETCSRPGASLDCDDARAYHAFLLARGSDLILLEKKLRL